MFLTSLWNVFSEKKKKKKIGKEGNAGNQHFPIFPKCYHFFTAITSLLLNFVGPLRVKEWTGSHNYMNDKERKQIDRQADRQKDLKKEKKKMKERKKERKKKRERGF